MSIVAIVQFFLCYEVVAKVIIWSQNSINSKLTTIEQLKTKIKVKLINNELLNYHGIKFVERK